LNFTLQLIPTDPLFRPSDEAVQIALRRLHGYFTVNEGIRHWISDKVSFWNAGENFESVICNHCDTDIFDWFISDMVSREFESTNDLLVTLPCCGKKDSLSDLTFDNVGGFACFALIICEGSNGEDDYELSDKELHRLEATLGCQLQLIWTGH
jgi:hypothetical protein